ncbi:uncharacterized protein N7498_010241 [Penicillium cinerascens]|uniref:SET domain-containing protein n=1 Tax=Penicillium cinerascens TaxID=70096 RepID=A0A9W9J8K8_9EURO|nr:uncharacterized protein N7498_010241 [Penicillium cinerascens]KAJ5191256.1 hypothetical protein N7498_010241 [Penicillium cinerascens]
MKTRAASPSGESAPASIPDENANQIMACIYWDINCAARFMNLPHASKTEQDTAITETIINNQKSFVDLVVYEYVKVSNTGPNFSATIEDVWILRFIRDHGWKIFSICAYSEAFQRACKDRDGMVEWQLLDKLIDDNARSIELFARCRSLDWSGPLVQHGRWSSQLRQTLSPEIKHLGKDHPHHTVKTLEGHLRRPRFNHLLQVHVNQHIYKADEYDGAPHPILRKPNWGACPFCSSTDICECRVTPTSDDALEIIQYSLKGLGIRALSNFKKGEWLGEFIGCIVPIERVDETTIYDLEQIVWDKSFKGLPWDDPQIKGKNKMRTVAYVAPAIQGNWTRFMNHSCNANVKFTATVVGKYATTVIEAVRDILIFDEVTIDYGPNYWTVEGRTCRCGAADCIHRERP